MRHEKSGRKLGRNSSHRKAMFRNMATSLFLHGKIQTTEAKAKELRGYAEKLISLGKRVPPSSLEGLTGDELAEAKAKRLHALRQARRKVVDGEALNRLFNEYSERFQSRAGGYTRITRVGHRTGDNAPMVVISLVGDEKPVSAKQEVAGDDVQGGGEE
ncbi:MAG: 50S ribosomal protein L17 [Myxococcota bacterium]|nr:50S ribosomal protein L17 [Myxococcota bacterium]